MAYIGLSIFLIFFIIFCLSFKSDLYIHQHDSSIDKELDTFNSNFETLKTLDNDSSNYKITNSHLYQ